MQKKQQKNTGDRRARATPEKVARDNETAYVSSDINREQCHGKPPRPTPAPQQSDR